ncbi:penicillin-binding protein activator LpoB [Marinomonas spartinae]|uniref:penicillin-binding protein activator LpoB n=1 Tax=Marinomonas spartinae TaxID=1792290 RepID=UPI0018F1EC0B|nr:penicillin-binding protein activator LpoB [Marinomonas spartinae]MBJ7555780.1 penicillin-binding protein activator LpoB [Marinomonas spartinae]
MQTAHWKHLVLILFAFMLTACSTTVQRINPDQEVALSDRWNNIDSKLVADAMINDMLSFPWYQNYDFTHKRKPTIIIQEIRNKSDEHIPVDTFINDIKRSLLRAGNVNFVVSGSERSDIRKEREDQALNAAPGTAAKFGLEQGANFALSGTISSIVDSNGDERVKFYQVDLKLINMTTNEEVWNGQKQIKKLSKKGFF